MLNLIDFGRFMTSEDTETLILALTSKTGQIVKHITDTEYFNLSEWGYI